MPSSQATAIDEADAPPSVEPFVRALGLKAATAFLLGFGGGYVHIPARPRAGSHLTQSIGAEAVTSLHRVFGRGRLKVPLAKPWLARQLEADGASRPEIARRLHVTRESVRVYLAKPRKVASAQSEKSAC